MRYKTDLARFVIYVSNKAEALILSGSLETFILDRFVGFQMDFLDSIGMIKKGVSDLIALRKDNYNTDLALLAHFEKCAAWEGDNWTFWDFLQAPEELALLKSQSLSYNVIEKRCADWMVRNEQTKPPLIREIETGSHSGMLERLREMIDGGEDPDAASLLKDTALGTARYYGYDDVFELLIELGADGEKAEFSTLHHAVRYCTVQDVERLIGTFDPLSTYITAPSVLQEAVCCGKADVVTALLCRIEAEDRLDDEEVDKCFSIAAGTGNPADIPQVAVRPTSRSPDFVH